jgi:DNA-binding NarL/FixJ family response regulator
MPVGDTELVVFEWPEETAEPAAPRQAKSAGPALSPRETAVADFLARGYQNLQIAANLGVSVHTIRHQVASILRKTGTFNRTDFAAWWHARR